MTYYFFFFSREVPLELWKESSREEFQPSTSGQIIKVIQLTIKVQFSVKVKNLILPTHLPTHRPMRQPTHWPTCWLTHHRHTTNALANTSVGSDSLPLHDNHIVKLFDNCLFFLSCVCLFVCCTKMLTLSPPEVINL